MVKCPNCGSTAQVKLVCHSFISNNRQILTEEFECGCGCHFLLNTSEMMMEYGNTIGLV